MAFLLTSVTAYLDFPLLPPRLPHAERFLVDTVGCFMKSGVLRDLTASFCKVCKQEFLCVSYCCCFQYDNSSTCKQSFLSHPLGQGKAIFMV